jgi:hypothetical protein
MRQREDLACHHAGRNNQIISSMSASGRTADGYQAMILARAFRLTLNLPFSLNKKRDIRDRLPLARFHPSAAFHKWLQGSDSQVAKLL